MSSASRRWAWRPTAAALCLSLAWPRPAEGAGEPERVDDATAGAEAASPTDAAPSTDPKPEEPPVELTPEQITKLRDEMRVEDAEKYWQEGSRLYHNGYYAEAAVEFERSYEAVPAAAALYGAALSYERASKPVEAVRTLERYLALPDCPPTPPGQSQPIDCTAQRSEAEQALAEQRRRVGSLTLDLGEGVELREVRVAGRTVPLDDFPMLLLPGTVDVEVFGMGPDERRSRPAYITAGETYELYVAPFDTATVLPPVVSPRGRDEIDEQRLVRRRRQLRTTFWVGVGATAAAGIATAVLGGVARYHQRRFNVEKCEEQCWEKDADGNPVLDADGNYQFLDRPHPLDHEAAVGRYLPITNAMIGVTVGVGVATALVGAFAFRKDPSPAKGERARAHVRLGGSGLVVRW